jgi:hypothetical protein
MGYALSTIGDLSVARAGPVKPDPLVVAESSPATVGAVSAVAVIVLGVLVGAVGLWAFERANR